MDDFNYLEDLAESQDTPFAGILISPYSNSSKTLFSVHREYEEWSPLILDGWASYSVQRPPGLLASFDQDTKAILSRYPNNRRLVDSLLIFWSVTPGTGTTP